MMDYFGAVNLINTHFDLNESASSSLFWQGQGLFFSFLPKSKAKNVFILASSVVYKSKFIIGSNTPLFDSCPLFFTDLIFFQQ